jgi:hypothetical protein
MSILCILDFYALTPVFRNKIFTLTKYSERNKVKVRVLGAYFSILGGLMDRPGNTNLGARITTADLLIKVACFVKNVNKIFNVEKLKLVGKRRSTAQSLPFQ